MSQQVADGNHIMVKCPHCTLFIQILKKQFNCKIFRHGIYKKNYRQIDPHMPKFLCDELKARDLIYGCGKPYKLQFINNEWKAMVCDYK